MKGVVLVTGGSQGIGRACVKALVEKGYHVCFSYLNNKEKADETLDQCHEPSHVKAIQCDSRNKDDLEAFFKEAQDWGLPLVGLVNNAGISGTRQPFDQVSSEDIENIFKTNVFGSFYACQIAFEALTEGACIVNISSLVAVAGGYRLAAYAASKAAINTLTLSLSKEFANRKVRVNAISPAIIETDKNVFDEDKKMNAVQNIPLGRLGTPEDVAKAVLWLLSDESSYVTGVVLPVTGGK